MTHFVNGKVQQATIDALAELISGTKATVKRRKGVSVYEYELLASFDIETSNIKVIDDVRNVVYIWTFAVIDFSKREDVSPKNIKESLTIIGRTMWDFELLLEELFVLCEKRLNIYVQNLNYEMDRILYNCPSARRHYDVDDSINIATHTPLTTSFGKLVFKDSWKLFNASLAEIGKQYGIEKLDYEYSAVRLPESKLTDLDYDYNTNDVYIVLYALCRLCVNNGIKSVTQIPSTSTRLTVYRNEHTEAINPIVSEYGRVRLSHGRQVADKRKIRMSDLYKKVVSENEIPEEQIAFWEHLFAGGYSHGNIYGVAKVWEDVISCDFCSAYPGAMVSCAYPYNIEKVESNLLDNFIYLMESNARWLNGVTADSIQRNQKQPCKLWFAGTIKIPHLKVKVHERNGNKWCAPVISTYKLLNTMQEIRAMRIDNGRLLEGTNIVLEVNSIDLLTIMLAYEEFEVVDCTELYLAKTQKPMHEYKLATIKKWYTDKTGLKKLQKWYDNQNRELERSDFICKDYQLVDENAVNDMIAMSKNAPTEFKNLIDDMYLKSKNCLNGQYGIMVMHINRDDIHIKLDNSGYSYEAGDIKATRQKELYVHGICITSYTRLLLIAFTSYIYEYTNILPLYWDTDSVKVAMQGTEKSELHEVVEMWNTGVCKWSDDMPAEIGTMDDGDGEYTHFIYLGAKRYMYQEYNKRSGKNEVHLTVAGLPKRKAAKYYGELYEKLGNDFYSLANYFRPNIFIHENLCGKLVPMYSDPEKENLYVEGEFKDDNGDVSKVEEWSGFLLKDVPFALVDLTKPENSMYYLAVAKLQGKDYLPDADYPPITLKRDENTGKIQAVKGRLDTPEVWIPLRGNEVFREQ